jgi:molybdate transport system ATP-binding protein
MTLAVRVRKTLSAQFVLDVDFDAAPGVTIVFGESGSGKTTLLRCVAGLAAPESGRIAIGERTLFDRAAGIDVAPSERRAGFVFQHLALFPHLTAAENIGYGLGHVPPPERQARITAIAESFRIGHLLPRRPGAISGGERQRVGLARSLVTDPDVLLLDEPLSALDYATQSRIIADLIRWNESRSIPILYVTHSQREVLALGERMLLLQGGAIVADGTPHDVLETPSSDRVAALSGFENILDAIVVARRPELGVTMSRLARTNLELETPVSAAEPGHAVRIAIRAGDIMIATERPRGLSARNIVAGRVASLARHGTVMRADVDVGVPIEVHLTPASSDALELRPGLDVWLVIKTRSCRLVSAL